MFKDRALADALSPLRKKRAFDWSLVVVAVLLVGFGLIGIANAMASPFDPTPTTFREILEHMNVRHVRLQLLWTAAGAVLMVVAIRIPYRFIVAVSPFLYWGSVALLALVLLTEAIKGTAGWFTIFRDRTFQPSEVSKLALIVLLARVLGKRGEQPLEHAKDLLLPLGVILLPLALIIRQPDWGTAMVYMAIAIGMLFVAKISWKLILGLVGAGVVALVPFYFYVVADSFRLQRFLVFLNPDAASSDALMTVTNSQLAVGSGQVFGKGIFSPGLLSTLNYVPENYTDFIFSVIGETMGFVGCAILLLLFGYLLFKLAIHASRTVDVTGRLIIVGVLCMFFFHIFEATAMTIGVMPVTGIPLPFVSYGGTSMLTNWIAIGLVLNVVLNRDAKPSDRLWAG